MDEFRQMHPPSGMIKYWNQKYSLKSKVIHQIFPKEWKEKYHAVLGGIECFPVVQEKGSKMVFENSWMDTRTYGGKRFHEGTDIIPSENIRGKYKVVSMTAGTVEKKGWLEKGGYRIGIRSDYGGYFYYAHLYQYAPGLEEGDRVAPGQLLGMMGDSGYGKKEGTVGKFVVHLHLGIYLQNGTDEISVNPYYILKNLQEKR